MSKGSSRRTEDTEKIRDNWDATFGKKKEEKPVEPKPLESGDQEHAK
jgi:hypothetical protein